MNKTIIGLCTELGACEYSLYSYQSEDIYHHLQHPVGEIVICNSIVKWQYSNINTGNNNIHE